MIENLTMFFNDKSTILLVILDIFLGIAVIMYCRIRISHYNTILTAKIKNEYIYLLFGTVGIIFAAISYSYLSPIIAFFMGLLIICVLMKTIYSISWKLCLFFSNDFLIILLLTGGIVPSLLSVVSGTELNSMPDFIIAIEAILAFFLSTAILFFLDVKKINMEHWEHFFKHKNFIKRVLYFQTYLFVGLVLLTIIYDQDVSIWFSWLVVFTYASILMAYQMVLDYVVRGSAVLMYKTKVDTYEEQLKHQVRNFDKQMQYISTMRKLKHDFKSFEKVMKELLTNGNLVEASSLLNQASKTGEETFEIYHEFSNNSLIQAILNSAYLDGINGGINFQAEVTIPEDLYIEKLDLCRILTNLVDNALEACKLVVEDNRQIIVKGHLNRNWFVLEVRNTFNGNVSTDGGKIKSIKGCEIEAGLGLGIVEDTLATYKGIMDVSWEDQVFIVRVYIPYMR